MMFEFLNSRVYRDESRKETLVQDPSVTASLIPQGGGDEDVRASLRFFLTRLCEREGKAQRTALQPPINISNKTH